MFSGLITVLMLVVFVSPVQPWDFPYSYSYDNGNYNVSWMCNKTTEKLYFKVQVKATGWVGFGLANEAPTNMTDYDVAVGGVYNGSCYLKDYLTTGLMKPRLDLQQDWKESNCSEKNGVTTLFFSRAKNTSDDNDTVVQKGMPLCIIWDYHNTTDVANDTAEGFPRHTARGFDCNKILVPGSEATTVTTSAPSTTTVVTSNSSTSATVNLTSASVTIDASQTVKVLGSIITSSPSSSSAKTSAPPPPPPPTTLVVTSMVKPTKSPTEKTCARLSFVVNASWDEAHGNKSSDSYKAVSGNISDALTMLYVSEKYASVEVSEVTLTEKDKMIHAEMKLCLVFNGKEDQENDLIEVVFIKSVKTGKLSGNILVVKGSAEFVALGVSFKVGKAKDGECEKCEGAGGPIVIVLICVKTEGFSCKGLKTTKELDDCVKYCPSSSAAITVPTLILATGIFLAFSFQ